MTPCEIYQVEPKRFNRSHYITRRKITLRNAYMTLNEHLKSILKNGN
jgi:hypothetical protein